MASRRPRESNLELLRVLCILSIVADHFVGQSGIASFSNPWSSLFFSTLTSCSRLSCSVFIIISAWFMVDGAFYFRRIASAWLTVLAYTVPLIAFMYVHVQVDTSEVIRCLLPVEGCPLWFVGTYIVLMLFSPGINFILQNAERRAIEVVLAVFGVLMVAFSTITARLGFFVNDFWPLFFVYLLTGYLKKHVCIDQIRQVRWGVVFVLGWLVLTVSRALVGYYGGQGFGGSFLPTAWSYLEFYRARMQTVPNLVLAYALFFSFFFTRIPPSKVVNGVAASVLGVYCLHQVPVWYDYLWKNICNVPYFMGKYGGLGRAIYVLVMIFLIGAIAVVIDFLRRCIMSYCLEKRVWYINACKAIDDAVAGRAHLSRRCGLTLLILVVAYFLMVAVLQVTGLPELPRDYSDVSCRMSNVFAVGFSTPEQTHVWTSSETAMLKFERTRFEDGDKLRFTAKVFPFLPAGRVNVQRMNVICNGTRVASTALRNDEIVNIEFSFVAHPNADGDIELLLELPDSVSPADLGLGSDDRKLAVAFKSISLKTAVSD